MDSHIGHPHVQEHNRDPQHLGTQQGEDEDHHEKKSVLKKVKEKAKKIKDTFKKHGHGPDDHDLDEKDDEGDEHGATTIRSGVPEQGDILKVPPVKFGDTKAMHDDPVGSNLERTDVKISDPKRDYVQPEPGVMLMQEDVLEPMDYSGSIMGSVLGGHEEISGQPNVNFGKTSEMGGGLHAPQNTSVSSLGEYKSKITDPGHTSAHGKEGHEGHIPDDHVLDEEDDKENEDAEMHGATTIRSGVPEQGDILKVPPVKFGDTKAMHDDPVGSNLERTDVKISDPKRDYVQPEPGVMLMQEDVLEPMDYSGSMGSVLGGHEEISGQPNVDFGKTSEMGGGLHAPQNTPVSSLGEYKSKITDPVHTSAHGKEGHLGQSRVDTTPVSSLGEYKSKITDPGHTSAHGKEGHLGQSRVDITPVSSLGEHKSKVTDASQTLAHGKEGHLGHLGQSRVNLDRPRGLEEDPYPQAYTPSNYQNKVTDPTNAGGEDVGITPIRHSLDKLNINAGTEQSSYTDRAISAKNAVVSMLGYGGNNDQHGDIKPQACTASSNAGGGGGDEQKPHQNLSTGSHDQFSAERPSNQSSTYTEKIPSATSAISDKAISAKNVVASTFGYGGNNDDDHHQEVTAKPGGSTSPEQHDKGVSESKAGQEKGVSVKDYFAEKLKPGEEDRALSEVISESLHKRKAEDSALPVGKVTESEEVTRRLGPDCGIERVEQSGYGKMVSDTVKGAFGSLFGKADENPSSQQSTGSTTGGTDGFPSSGSGAAEHPSLQGSGK
ncbi:hypothetical protein ACE6H2_009006 [Prunus campanulata]